MNPRLIALYLYMSIFAKQDKEMPFFNFFFCRNTF